MRTHKLFALAAMLTVGTIANAQYLSLKHKRYDGKWGTESMTMSNKPNGNSYRLREEVRITDLPRPEGTDGLQLFISEKIGIGYQAFYRIPTASPNYDKFMLALHDNDKQLVQVLDLLQIAGESCGEVVDVRHDGETNCIYFNVTGLGMKDHEAEASRIYCYSLDKARLLWKSETFTSNDIIVVDGDYVFSSYGGSFVKDYVFMLDKRSGKRFAQMLTRTAVENMEVKHVAGKAMLYAVDYNNTLYIYDIHTTGTAPAVKTKK
ncbi:MAG: hypothetical protein KBT12_05755 [Bacteroidales bacterium]|nr:hypothetical protein [Candidatus Physcousia equi]